MSCRRCGSDKQEQHAAEIAIHHKPSLATLHRLPVLVCTMAQICCDCGYAEFNVSTEQLSEFSTAAEQNVL